MKKYTHTIILSILITTFSSNLINNNAFAKDEVKKEKVNEVKKDVPKKEPVKDLKKETPKKEESISFKGSIFDDKTKSPLKDVYIKQSGTLNTVLSDDKGNFNINILPDGDKKLIFAKEGYESISINITASQSNFKLALSQALVFKNNDLPQPHSETADLFNYSSKPFSSNFTAMYQGEFKAGKLPSFTSDSVFTRGIAINELSLSGQIRYQDILGQLKLYRGRFPIDIENFEYKPAYNLDNLQVQISGGKIISSKGNTEFYAGLSYLLHFITPDNKSNGDNKPIPFTNSYQDFPQTRQSLGVTGIWGYKYNESIFFAANGSLFPVVITTFDGLNKNNIGYHGMLDLGFSAKYETLSGIYLTSSINNQFYFGFNNLLENATFLNFGLSLDPFKMASLTNGGLK